MDAAPPNPTTIAKLVARMDECAQKIQLILDDAERQVAPLRAELERYRTALEVIRALEEPGKTDGGRDVASWQEAFFQPSVFEAVEQEILGERQTVRSLILMQLDSSELPLTKDDLVQRLPGVKETTVGSTLSNMVREGSLVKFGSNRYWTPLRVRHNESRRKAAIKSAAKPAEGPDADEEEL